MKNVNNLALKLENEILINSYKTRYKGWEFDENYHKHFPLDKFYLFAFPQDFGKVLIDVSIKIDKRKHLNIQRKERSISFYRRQSSYQKAKHYSQKIAKQFKSQLYPDEDLVFKFAVEDFNPTTVYPLFVHRSDYSRDLHLDCLFISCDGKKQIAWLNLNALKNITLFTEKQYKNHVKKLTGGKLKIKGITNEY